MIFIRVIPSVKVHIRPALFRSIGKHHTARGIFCTVRVAFCIFFNGIRTIPVRGKIFYANTVVGRILTYPFGQEPSVAVHTAEGNRFNARSNAIFCFDRGKRRGRYVARNQLDFRCFSHSTVVKLTVNLNIDFFIYFICALHKVFKRCAIVAIFFIPFDDEIFFYEITFIPSYDIHIFGKNQRRANAAYGKQLFDCSALINRTVEYGGDFQVVFAVGINHLVCKREAGFRYVNVIAVFNPYTVCRCVFNRFPIQNSFLWIICKLYSRFIVILIIVTNGKLRRCFPFFVFDFYVKRIDAFFCKCKFGCRCVQCDVRFIFYAFHFAYKIIGKELYLIHKAGRRDQNLRHHDDFRIRLDCAYARRTHDRRADFRCLRLYFNRTSYAGNLVSKDLFDLKRVFPFHLELIYKRSLFFVRYLLSVYRVVIAYVKEVIGIIVHYDEISKINLVVDIRFLRNGHAFFEGNGSIDSFIVRTVFFAKKFSD